MASFYFFDTLPSTMDEARSRVLQGAEEGSVIVAFHQSQGRGRRRRVWESGPGNLYFTYITYLDIPLSKAPQLSFVACVAVGEILRPLLPPSNSLAYKWPNDVLLNEKKVSGILLEVVHVPEKKEIGCLIGCGVNLKFYPEKGLYPTTSLHNEGIYLSLEEVLHGISSSLQHYILLWRKQGFSPIQTLWMKRAANLEKKITLTLDEKTYEGIFEGIDEAGLLVLKTAEGRVSLMAGEILAKDELGTG